MAVMPTEQELRAFVGSNANYYLKAWRLALAGEGGASGFNVAAFFLSGLWLGYRKMYGVVLILFGIILAETVLELAFFEGVLKIQGSPPGLTALVGLIVAIVVGVCGNGWYLSRARRIIGEVRAQGLSEEGHLRALAARGGSSLGAALGLFFLIMLVVFAIDMVLAVLLGGV
jgi:hypothetical protein